MKKLLRFALLSGLPALAAIGCGDGAAPPAGPGAGETSGMVVEDVPEGGGAAPVPEPVTVD